MTIKKIDRVACQRIVKESLAQLTTYCEDNGLTVEQDSGASYDPDGGTVTFKIKFVLEGRNPAQDEFNKYAFRYGLVEGDFGVEFTNGGKRFEICGLSPRSPKRPLLGKAVGTEDVYKFTREVINKIVEKRDAA